jgi:hypothetical protein
MPLFFSGAAATRTRRRKDGGQHTQDRRSSIAARLYEPQKRSPRAQLVAVARRSGNIPKLIVDLQIQATPATSSRDTTRSACRRPHTLHEARHPPDHHQTRSASSSSSTKPSPTFPTALEETPAWRGRRRRTKVPNEIPAAVSTISPRKTQAALPRSCITATPKRWRGSTYSRQRRRHRPNAARINYPNPIYAPAREPQDFSSIPPSPERQEEGEEAHDPGGGERRETGKAILAIWEQCCLGDSNKFVSPVKRDETGWGGLPEERSAAAMMT